MIPEMKPRILLPTPVESSSFRADGLAILLRKRSVAIAFPAARSNPTCATNPHRHPSAGGEAQDIASIRMRNPYSISVSMLHS